MSPNCCRYLDFRKMKNYNSLIKFNRQRSYATFRRRYVTLSGDKFQQNFAAQRPRFENRTGMNNLQQDFRSRFRRMPPDQFPRFSYPPPNAPTNFEGDSRSVSFRTNFGPENVVQEQIFRIEQDIQQYSRIDPKILEEFVKNLRAEDKLTPSNALTIFKCCGSYLPMYSNQKRIELLHKCWDLFQSSHGVKYDVSHYNALLHLYLYNEYDFSPFEFLAKMEKEKIEPNRVTYQRLIQRFAQIGDIDRAGKILEHMKSLDMPINEHVFNSLLYANIKTKNEDGVKAILEIMKKNEVEKTTDTYLEMMKAYAEMNDVAAIEKILSEESDVSFSDREILETVYFCAKNSNREYTDKLLGYVKKTPGYVHDAVNCALRLNALGVSDVAVKILNTIPRSVTRTGEPANIGAALLRQAVDLNFNENDIVALCENMKTAEVHNRGMEFIYTWAAENSNKKLATTALTNLIADKNFPLRPHCFYPLIAMNSIDRDLDGLKNSFDLIDKSIGRFDLNSLTNFFWPNIEENDEIFSLDKVGDKFPNVPRQKFVSSYVIRYLIDTDQEKLPIIKEKILNAISKHGRDIYLSTSILEAIVKYLLNTKDVSTCIELLMNLQKNLHNSQILEIGGNPIDTFLRQCVFLLPAEVHLDLLNQLSSKGFAGSKFLPLQLESVSKVRRVTDDVKNYFEKIAENGRKFIDSRKNSVELLPKTSLEDLMKDETFDTKNFAEFARTASYESVNRAMLKLSKNNKIHDVLKLYKEIEPYKLKIHPTVLLSMVAAFVRGADAENALKFFNQAVRTRIPLDINALLKFSCFLAVHDRFDEISQVFDAAVRPLTDDYRKSNDLSKKLIDLFVTKNKFDQGLNVAKILVDRKFLKPENYVFAPFINSCLERNDSNKAVELFENLHSTYKIVPDYISLMTVLAETGQSENLGKVVSILQTSMGEIKSSIYFAISLSNASKFLASRKVMQPLIGEREFPTVLVKYIKYLTLTKNSKNLLNLLRSTKGLPRIDREMLYKSLLTVYQENKDHKSASNAWTMMQEENFSPSDELMSILSSIYAANKQETPFEPQVSVDESKKNGSERSAEGRFERFFQRDPQYILKDLLASPKSESRIIDLAEKSSAKRHFGPTAALWMYYLISKRFDEAEKLLKSVKSTDTKSFFGEINLISLCKELKFYGKEDVLRYLLEKKIFEEFSRKILYSYLIGLNLDREKFESACNVIKEAESDGVGIHQLNSAILARLSVELNRRGLSVPFNLERKGQKFFLLSVREANIRRFGAVDGSEPIRQNETFVAADAENVKI